MKKGLFFPLLICVLFFCSFLSTACGTTEPIVVEPIEKDPKIIKEETTKPILQTTIKKGSSYLLLKTVDEKNSEAVGQFLETAKDYLEGEAGVDIETLTEERDTVKEKLENAATRLEEIAPDLPGKYKEAALIFAQLYRENSSAIETIYQGILDSDLYLAMQGEVELRNATKEAAEKFLDLEDSF